MSGCCDLLVQYLSGSTALGIYGCMPNPSWEVVRNVTKSADFAALSAVTVISPTGAGKVAGLLFC